MITMFHGNAVRIEKGVVYADRKFFNGMRLYVENIRAPIITVHPMLCIGEIVMDGVEIPIDKLGFSILALDTKEDSKKIDKKLHDLIRNSALVYGNTHWGNTKICKKLNIPYILFLETDVRTQISVNTLHLSNPFRRVARIIKIIIHYCTVEMPAIRSASSLHCNGYPVYNETRALNKNQLLYLDSRMSVEKIIQRNKLEVRMKSRENRRHKLLFSGRYEKIKGALDCVKVAIECIRRNLDIELHCYGYGRLREDMLRESQLANASDRIFIHEAIPYPELVLRSYEFDIFICCHVQSDPSCTYLEAFGAGLPIVGYANRMWKHLSMASKAGCATEIHRPDLVASSIGKLIEDPVLLNSMTHFARDFAIAHTFEHEFSLRTESLQEALSE